MVKRSIEQEIRNKNFGARSGHFEKNAVVKNQETKQLVHREFLEIVGNGKRTGQCVTGDNCSFRHYINKRGKMTQSNPSPNSFMQQNEREASRTRSPRGRSPSGRMFRWLCKDYIRGVATTHCVKKRHPPECFFYKTKSGCRFGVKCSYGHRQVDEQPSKRYKTNDDKSEVAILKKNDCTKMFGNLLSTVTNITRDGCDLVCSCFELKLGPTGRRSSSACVFQDVTPPKSILRKSSDMQKPIQRVKFTKAIARHTKIRDQNSSLGFFFAQVNLMSAVPTLQNLKILHAKRQSGKSKVPAKQR